MEDARRAIMIWLPPGCGASSVARCQCEGDGGRRVGAQRVGLLPTHQPIVVARQAQLLEADGVHPSQSTLGYAHVKLPPCLWVVTPRWSCQTGPAHECRPERSLELPKRLTHEHEGDHLTNGRAQSCTSLVAQGSGRTGTTHRCARIHAASAPDRRRVTRSASALWQSPFALQCGRVRSILGTTSPSA
jgi:hypothetical protein